MYRLLEVVPASPSGGKKPLNVLTTKIFSAMAQGSFVPELLAGFGSYTSPSFSVPLPGQDIKYSVVEPKIGSPDDNHP
jgi:hypothetical protein